ncbi:hypothetical protein THRCLA_08141 [Thraustotheca clavata]|uniref:Uncharacterized protein n=1 Tax=Thraustotheca clavata TaxID=74557 RepID=A0A1V9Z9B4_9STRA|nr:hypothetical protein THRCLA_08141 [Thraustotheca clavata]
MLTSKWLRAGIVIAFALCLWCNNVYGPSMRTVVAQHRSLITPAKQAFSIWGLIYFTITIFVVREAAFPSQTISPHHAQRLYLLFIASCAFNMGWLIVFSTGHIVWSFLVILILWGITGAMYLLVGELVKPPTVYELLSLRSHGQYYECTSWQDYICIRVPFTLYFSWTCGATLINLTVSLAGLGLDLGLWIYIACLIILLGIHTTALIYRGDIVFAVVGIWTLSWQVKDDDLTPTEANYLDVIQVVATMGAIILGIVVVGLFLYNYFFRKPNQRVYEGKESNAKVYGTL